MSSLTLGQWGWQSILASRVVLCKGIPRQVGVGTSTKEWEDHRIPLQENSLLATKFLATQLISSLKATFGNENGKSSLNGYNRKCNHQL